MQILDIMSAHQAITLYYEKHHAMREGNMEKLRELKKTHPEIFDKKKDAEIRALIEYAKEFLKTDHYKDIHRQILKETLTVINKDSLDE